MFLAYMRSTRFDLNTYVHFVIFHPFGTWAYARASRTLLPPTLTRPHSLMLINEEGIWYKML